MSQASHSEGVIQYERKIEATPRSPVGYSDAVEQLLRWRATLHAFGWVGQHSGRYGGLGFGNISMRIGQRTARQGCRQFLITGSQTGKLATLGTQHLAWVTQYNVSRNQLKHTPSTTPSSESLTHAAAYDGHATLKACIHIHCPVIWNHRETLSLPRVSERFGYGTVQMAEKIRSLCSRQDPDSPAPIIMDGHQDGVLVAAKTLESAFMSLLKAFQISVA